MRQLNATGGLCSTIDVLGEDMREAAAAAAMLREYAAILDDLGSCPYANISSSCRRWARRSTRSCARATSKPF